MNMKGNIKIFLVALVIGMALAFFLAYKFPNITVFASSSEVTLFHVGAYNSLERAEAKKEEYPQSLIYENEGVYKVVIGVYQDSTVKSLMASYFQEQNIIFYEDTLKVDNTLLRELESYELLIKASGDTYYDTINASLLSLFDEYINPKN